MGLKFKNNKVTVVNFGLPMSEEEVALLKKNYDVTDVEEINFKCRGFAESTKPWYLQCVDWVKLIPEGLIRDNSFALRMPDRLPKEIGVYMVVECYSRSGRLPKVIETRENSFFRIVDLEYEVGFSRNKRREISQDRIQDNTG